MTSFRKIRIILHLLVAAFIFTGCVDKDPAIFVEVNGRILSTDDVLRQFKSSNFYKNSAHIQKNDLIDFVEKNLLTDLLFRADGYQRKLDQTPEAKAVFDLQKRDILIGTNGVLFQSIIPKTISVSEAELRKLYLQRKESVKIAEIIVNPASLADSLYRLLQNGANFESLAKIYSIDLQTRNNAEADARFITYGLKNPVFDNTIRRLKIGGISEPIELSDGFHIVKLLDRKQVAQKPYVEIRDTLLSHLQKVKRDLFLEDYKNSLFHKYDVTINEKLLPRLLAYLSASARTTHLSNALKAFPEQTLAQYHGGELTAAQFVEFYQALPARKRYPMRHSEDIVAMICACLTPNLLYLDAINRGLDQDAKFFKVMRRIKDRYVEKIFRQEFVDSQVSVSQSEVEGYYGEHYEIYKKLNKNTAFKNIRDMLLKEKQQAHIKKITRKLKKQFIVRYNSRAINKALKMLNADNAP